MVPPAASELREQQRKADEHSATQGPEDLTVRAERSDKIERKHRSEFRYGSFSRAISLPVNADEGAVTASYRDGILEISVRLKTEQKASAKKIEVATGK